MSDTISVAAGDRLLILAPHPDDESIATGGLLQVARELGASIRVIVLTDGDNNPWPQRWIEKRWHVGADERKRWGARRREEARVAMRILGMDDTQMRFFGLPDLGLTDLLMRASPEPVERLRAELDDFAPTMLVLPALSDLHPDHSAAHILLRIALAQADVGVPRMFSFAVHGHAIPGDTVVELDAMQREIKQAAILAHASQMRLSRRRFLRYATRSEAYRVIPARPHDNPRLALHARLDADHRLHIEIEAKHWRGAARGNSVSVVAQFHADDALRLIFALPRQSGDAPIFDAIARREIGTARIRFNGDSISIDLPLPRAGRFREGFVKLGRPQPGLWVLDHCGWQAVAT
ncbi:MAG: PIG-L deacetylase family protein [Rudaea sp.]